MRVLMVSPDSGLAQGLRLRLSQDGHQLEWRAALRDALLPRTVQPQLIVYDLAEGSPARWKRLANGRRSLDTPHIVVGAYERELDDPVRALRMGADDYVARPVSLTELALRVASVSRRVGLHRAKPRALAASDKIEVDPVSRLVLVRGRHVRLSRCEFCLLDLLMANEGRLTSRRDLATLVGGKDDVARDRAVSCCIWSLQRKLDDDPASPRLIVTRRGLGYVFGEHQG